VSGPFFFPWSAAPLPPSQGLRRDPAAAGRGRRAVGTLEGSRFNACLVPKRFSGVSRIRPKNVKTGGSRELPSVWLLSRFVKIDLPCERLSLYKNRAGAIPGSRLLQHVSATQMIKIRGRGHRMQAKAAPLQGCRPGRPRQRGSAPGCSLVDALERPSLLAESFKENWN